MSVMNCLKCDGTLVDMTFRPVGGRSIQLSRCGSCNGIWMDREQLDQYLDQGSWGIDSWPVDEQLMRDLDEKTARCPRCDLRLVKAPSTRDPAVVIDFCDKCAGVWLDATELDQLEAPRQVDESLLDRFLKMIGKV